MNSINSMKLLSIILPVFNVESYIERCLRSLENQNLPKENYEIICINDGSIDDSQKIIEKLQLEFDNIILINQVNQGVSKARNVGIQKTNSNYLLFIDPDDYIEHNTLRNVLDIAYQFDVQVLVLGYRILDQFDQIVDDRFKSVSNFTIHKGIDLERYMKESCNIDPDSLCGILLKSSFIKDNRLYYLNEIPYLEDGELISRILCLSNKCMFYKEPFYNRTTRLGSATKSDLFYTQKAIKGFIMSADNLIKFKYKNTLNEENKEFINKKIVKFTTLPFFSSIKNTFSNFNYTIKLLKFYNIRRLDLKGVSKSYLKYGLLFNLSPIILMAFLIHNSIYKKIIQIFKG